METFFEKYNQYILHLIRVECSERQLDFEDVLNSYKSSSVKGTKDDNELLDAAREQAMKRAAEDEKAREEAQKLLELARKKAEEEKGKQSQANGEEYQAPKVGPLSDSPYDLEFEDGYYVGETKDGLMHGKGTRYWFSGKKWEGTWVDGEGCGRMVVTFDDALLYDGEMENSLPNGLGRYVDPENGFVYEGNFVDFQREGEGCYYNDRGDKVYEGEWKADRYHGYGMYFLQGKCRYDGMWEYGKRNGQGVSYDETGKEEYNGEWKNDNPVKQIDKIKLASYEYNSVEQS